MVIGCATIAAAVFSAALTASCDSARKIL